MERSQLKVGQIVRVDPGTDLFMRGVTSGRIEKIGRKWIHIRHAGSGRVFRIVPELLWDGMA